MAALLTISGAVKLEMHPPSHIHNKCNILGAFHDTHELQAFTFYIPFVPLFTLLTYLMFNLEQPTSYWFVDRISEWREVKYFNKYLNCLSKGLRERTWLCSDRPLNDNWKFLSLKTMDLGVGNVPRIAVLTGRPGLKSLLKNFWTKCLSTSSRGSWNNVLMLKWDHIQNSCLVWLKGWWVVEKNSALKDFAE